jgi:hypothetical protein
LKAGWALALVAAACAGGARARPAASAGAAGALADSAALIGVVRELAGPAMEGRGIGTHGLERAADYLAMRFRELGLLPAGAGGYFQRFEVTTGVKVSKPCVLELGGRRYRPGRDFQPLGFSANGIASAPVAFAGYGIVAPEYGYDDYAGLDVRDRLVLVLAQEPGELDSTSVFEGTVNTPHAELRTKAIVAREHGALGLLVVTGPRFREEEELRPPRPEGGYMSSGLVAAQVSRRVAEQLLGGHRLAELQETLDRTGRPRGLALAESARVTVTLVRQRAFVCNVVGRLAGRDTARVLVIGAHYDHLGYGGESSRGPRTEPVLHPGADDNASGVAAMLGAAAQLVARARAGRPLEHDVVICAFTGEEMGLVGSARYVDDPPRPVAATEAMINLDMVGRLKRRRLVVFGSGSAAEFPALLQNLGRDLALDVRGTSDGFGPSDYSSFYKRQVPVLGLFTGAHADYHMPSDTWDKVSGTSLWTVAGFTGALVESLDARPRVTYQATGGDSELGRARGGAGFGAYLGTIPDYTQTEGGVLLSGVREGGPAEQAGLRGGDVVVMFDGVSVDNIYDYSYALRSRKPGQRVEVTVQRAGDRKTLTVTLGRRP